MRKTRVDQLRIEQERVNSEASREQAACDQEYLTVSAHARLLPGYWEYSAHKRPPIYISRSGALDVGIGDFDSRRCKMNFFGQSHSDIDEKKCIDELPSMYRACRNQALQRHAEATQKIDEEVKSLENDRALKRF